MSRIQTLRHDRRGAAMVEFAIALPVLLILFLGGYQLTDAIACKRKVTIATRAVGDMASQYRALTRDDLDTLLAASTQILAPYSATPAQIRISQITVESNSPNYRIDWSRGRNIAARTPGRYGITGLPLAYRQPGMVFIRTETSYAYAAAFSRYLSPVTFTDDIWLLPRQTATIPLS